MRLLTFLAACSAAAAAPPRSIEVFGHLGAFYAGADEGSLGHGASYGGAVVVPIAGRLAVDVDVLTARTRRDRPGGSFRLRRTLVLPSLVYRWGSRRVYVFAGGGLGRRIDETYSRESNFADWYTPPVPPWRQIGPREWEISNSESRTTVHGRVGVVVEPARRLLLRFDWFGSWKYVLPDTGIRLGVGFRFPGL
jgi:hypothetical protein